MAQACLDNTRTHPYIRLVQQSSATAVIMTDIAQVQLICQLHNSEPTQPVGHSAFCLPDWQQMSKQLKVSPVLVRVHVEQGQA